MYPKSTILSLFLIFVLLLVTSYMAPETGLET